jgi:hypothetical protein
MTQAARTIGRAEVLRRLRAGEALRTGYTFNRKAWFANGDEVADKVMRQLDQDGLLLQDAAGNITAAPAEGGAA